VSGQARSPFQYAILRVVPAVERGECLNAGIILFCRPRRYLAARVHLDRGLLAAFAPDCDPAVVRAHLDAVPRVCAGDASGGDPIAALSQAERFHWLVAPASTIVQPSEVHTGLTGDPAAMLDHLFATLVRRPESPSARATIMAPAAIEGALEGEAGAWAREHLDRDIVGWVSTRSPDGRVQSSVVSFLWEGDSILFYSRPATPKLRNIDASPEVAFHLQSDPYGDHALTIEGLASVDEAAPASDVHEAYRSKYREPLAHWEMDEAQTARDFSVPIRIRPVRIRCW
jgi:PPOX class probable F420-dependent enzyme